MVRRLGKEPGFAEQLQLPALVWNAPSTQTQADDWMPTSAGTQTRPTIGEPLVFMVEKVPGRVNPFAMGVTIGRVESNDVVVDDSSVSRFHAWIQYDDRSAVWLVTDAESKNGTFLDGTRIIANKRHTLNDRAMIRFGDAEMRFLTAPSFLAYLQKAQHNP